MGKVFSFEEVKSGKVPTLSNFLKARDLAFEALNNSVNRGEVVSAAIFGSVAKGTPSIRSDFDLLVIASKTHPLSQLARDFNLIYKETNVAIEPIIVPQTFATKGFHTVDASFCIHLRNTLKEENIIGENPLTMIVPYDLPITIVHEQYLIQKLRRLREGTFSHSRDDEYHVLQRALEAPINTGRRTLQALHALGVIDDPLNDDGKLAVRSLFKDVFAGTIHENGFNFLIEQDEKYTTLLRETIAGKVSQSEYEEILHTMSKECIIEAIAWISDVSSMYMNRLEGSRTSIEGLPRVGGKERM